MHRLTSRIGDVDTNRHVNNVAILSWYADAVAAWQSGRLGDPDGGPPEELAATAWEVQYVDEVAHPRTYDVVLAVDADGGRPALPGRPVLRRAVRGARRRLRRRRAARPDRRRAPTVIGTLIGTHGAPSTLDPS